MAKKPFKKISQDEKKAAKNPMAFSGPVEDEIMKRYQVGCIATAHADRDLYLIDTGILDLNMAVGTMGYLGGRMSLVWGDRQAAKSLLMLCTIAQVQRDGGRAALVDPEGTFDAKFAQMLGVDISKLFLVSAQDKRIDPKTNTRLLPLSGEEFFDIVNLLIHSGAYHFVGMDSLTACVPMALLGKPTTDQAALKAAQAIMNSQMLQKTNAYLTMAPHCHFQMISQSRDVPMQIGGASGPKPSGGKAAGFYVSYELMVRKNFTHREKLPISPDCSLKLEQDVAIDITITLTKNKVARVMEPATVHVDLRTGVCQATDVVRTAKKMGVIAQSSSWLSLDQWKWNGEEAAINDFKLHQDLYDYVRAECINKLGAQFTNLAEVGSDEQLPEAGSDQFQEKLSEFKETVDAEIGESLPGDDE
jgi:recombination protein RecA